MSLCKNIQKIFTTDGLLPGQGGGGLFGGSGRGLLGAAECREWVLVSRGGKGGGPEGGGGAWFRLCSVSGVDLKEGGVKA